ncbi:MAG TPA: hypothetical protein VGD62_11910 [Acidobacteriaceae bacterium]
MWNEGLLRGLRLVPLAALVTAMLVAISVPLLAQQRCDPLTESQADQVRELGDRPMERIKLYLKFVEERTAAIRELSVDSHENNRPAELRAKLEEFTRLTDELSDNIDSYATAHADVRKALKAVVDASAKWPEVLHKAPGDPTYEFSRRTALDAAASSYEQAKRVLAEQTAYFAAHKDEAGKNGKAPSSPEPK